MQHEFDKVVATGKAAEQAGVGLNAGHDLTRENLPRLVAALPNLAEVSIGHAITADALMLGMGETVRLFRRAIARSFAIIPDASLLSMPGLEPGIQ